MYSDGTTYKLLAAIFSCKVEHLVEFFRNLDIKYCQFCKIVHSRSQFTTKDTTDGLAARCKKHFNIYRKQYYEQNKEKGIRDSIIWKQNNKERVNELRRIRNQTDEYKKRNREYIKNRVDTDPAFRIRLRFSNLMYYHLKAHTNDQVKKSNKSWTKLVDYSLSELVQHLESKFQDGMNWENYGEWHIDHIIPVSKFNIISLECDEFKKCWSLDNLQPLWAYDNIIKSNNV